MKGSTEEIFSYIQQEEIDGSYIYSRLGEMAGLSLGVAVVSFGIGVLVRKTLGIDL